MPEPAGAPRSLPAAPAEPAVVPRAAPAPRAPETAPRPLPSAARPSEPAAAPPRASADTATRPDGGAAAAKPEELRDKLREDWKTIRRGFETAGDDLKEALRDLGRKLWP
jgi:hypothetical protein